MPHLRFVSLEVALHNQSSRRYRRLDLTGAGYFFGTFRKLARKGTQRGQVMQIGPIEIEVTWPTIPNMDLSSMPPSTISPWWVAAIVIVLLLLIAGIGYGVAWPEIERVRNRNSD
jgi:hypothetical protein